MLIACSFVSSGGALGAPASAAARRRASPASACGLLEHAAPTGRRCGRAATTLPGRAPPLAGDRERRARRRPPPRRPARRRSDRSVERAAADDEVHAVADRCGYRRAPCAPSPATTTPRILPEALDAIAAANHGHAVSYGADEWTARLQDRVREQFGADAIAFPVFNGTGANVVGLRAMLRPWQGVICAETRAPERRRGRRARGDGRDQAADRPDAGRQAHAGAGGAPDRADRRRARRRSRASCRSRSRPSSARSTRRPSWRRSASSRTRTGCCSTSTARGWRTRRRRWTCRCGRSRPTWAPTSSRFGGTKIGLLRGEAVVVLQPELADLAALPAQAVDAARVEDALRLGPARGAADRRAVAPRGRPRERDGAAAGARPSTGWTA